MKTQRILVTGGAGYIGAVLVPKLLEAGHTVTVFDCLLFGTEPLAAVAEHERLTVVEGDIRDHAAVSGLLAKGFDTVIHLAAISNDPSSDLDPDLTKGVNLDALAHLMPAAKEAGVSRFLYASSASVYGIKDTPDVTEDLDLEPITLYAKYKAAGEEILNGLVDDGFCGVSVRAATVCGHSPRLRLDLTINILTSHALTRGAIRVFGGSQLRPNIHIEDLTDFYVFLLTAPAEKVAGQAFNVSIENDSVMGLAQMIQQTVDPAIPITVEPTDDIRSYHLSAAKLNDQLGFHPKNPLTKAVQDLMGAFQRGEVDVTDDRHRNVAWMKQHPDFWRMEA
jgi:nucleoside-diphosphate-sugar epimerase